MWNIYDWDGFFIESIFNFLTISFINGITFSNIMQFGAQVLKIDFTCDNFHKVIMVSIYNLIIIIQIWIINAQRNSLY